MNIEIILIVFGLSQIFANCNKSDEFYNSPKFNGLLYQNMLLQINTILMGNQQINKNLEYLNKRFDAQEISEKKLNVSKDINILKQKDGAWTVIQRRMSDQVDFNKTWAEYERGFGWPNENFFIGLKKLHALTTNGDTQELWINLKDFDGVSRYAIFDKFVVGSAEEKYPLKELGKYRGTAGDSLHHHMGCRFSTKENSTCGEEFGAGWWFGEKGNLNGNLNYCYESNLNGPYYKAKVPATGGIAWKGFRDWNYSLKYVEMLIRSKPQM